MWAAAPSAPKKRKGRGPAKGEAMLCEVADGSRIRVPFDEETLTFKGLDRNGTWYDSAIGILTREECEPYHDSLRGSHCTSGHKSLKDCWYDEWFDIDYTYENGVYRDRVERDAKRCYKEWKSNLHDHFKYNGAREDPDRQKSATNSSNRAKKLSKSKQGRIPYTRHRANKTDPETQETKSVIDNWKELNPDAEEIHHLLDERVAEAAANGPIDECGILADTLGTRRGHMNGVGPSLSRRAIAQRDINEYQRVIRDLEERLQERDATEAHLRAVIAQMREICGRLIPHVQLPDVPPPPPGPNYSCSSSAQPPNTDDDDDGDDDFV
ncbi:hypothetical protein PHJA_002319100 [Phtheirospermum japonicum]|uniref:Uncharacterized protein n=1 Tax=Phtheirospermum japonicum TaxID=374723 RepID=A0A830D5R9_9LAMI|nr:hypothetical protein PHJA_002319100 [Phtheirospermum japonicum]